MDKENIQDFIIADEKIYIKTYFKKNGKQEFLILNSNGELLNRVFLSDIKTEIFSPELYCIKNNIFYYLKENEDTELYELHCEKI